MRWGELCRAQSTDVDPKGNLVVSRTKSGKLRRVPLAPKLLKEVRLRVGKLVPYGEDSAGGVNRLAKKYTGLQGLHLPQTGQSLAGRRLEAGGVPARDPPH